MDEINVKTEKAYRLGHHAHAQGRSPHAVFNDKVMKLADTCSGENVLKIFDAWRHGWLAIGEYEAKKSKEAVCLI